MICEETQDIRSIGSGRVQVERIAQTEPEDFQLPSPEVVRKPLQKAGQLLGVRRAALPAVVQFAFTYSKKNTARYPQCIYCSSEDLYMVALLCTRAQGSVCCK